MISLFVVPSALPPIPDVALATPQHAAHIHDQQGGVLSHHLQGE